MTVGQRRAWLALEAQNRRREHLPAILLTSDGHGHLTWTLNFRSPYINMNIYKSADGVTWPDTAYDCGDVLFGYLACNADPGYFRICVCDNNGVAVPPYSNAVYSDGL